MPNNVQYKHNQLIMEGLRVRNRLVSVGATTVLAVAIAGGIYGHNTEIQRQNQHAMQVEKQEAAQAALEAAKATPTPSPTPSPTITPRPAKTPLATPATRR